jgi:hypothetical protein
MSTEGKYIYCIIDGHEERDLGIEGIGGRGDRVHTVVFEDIAAVASNSPIVKYPISKENTLTHMKVMEKLMDDYIILPVKFGTIAEGSKRRNPQDRIKIEILMARYTELKDLLNRMTDKIELGLKALWMDMEAIFKEIVEENKDIEILKKRISTGNTAQPLSHRIELGEMVKKALEAKRIEEELEILKMLDGAYSKLRRNKIFGDNMITNSAFLLEKHRIDEFDNIFEQLNSAYKDRIRFKYVGPVPPCNFVELVINLKGDEDERGKESTSRI